MRNKDITKEEMIMRSALSLIAEVGLSGLKMNDLAQKAKLATGTVYIYFRSKEALIQRLYSFVFKSVFVDLQNHILDNMSTKEKIKQYCFNYVSEMIKNPEYKVFIEQFFRSPYFNTEDKSILDIEIYIAPIKAIIQEAQSAQIVKNTPADLLIHLTRGALENYAHSIAVTKKEVEPAEFDLVFDYIWNGAKYA